MIYISTCTPENDTNASNVVVVASNITFCCSISVISEIRHAHKIRFLLITTTDEKAQHLQ